MRRPLRQRRNGCDDPVVFREGSVGGHRRSIRERGKAMSHLVVVVYPDQYRAAEIVAAVQRVQDRDSPQLHHPVSVTKDMHGTLHVNQGRAVTADSAAAYDLNTAIADSLSRSLRREATVADDTDGIQFLHGLGVSDWFFNRLRVEFTAGRSAIILLSRDPDTDDTLMEICRFSGIVLQTALADDAEQRLRRSIIRQSL
jgi:uncharacterized membrane protein